MGWPPGPTRGTIMGTSSTHVDYAWLVGSQGVGHHCLRFSDGFQRTKGGVGACAVPQGSVLNPIKLSTV